MWEAEAGRMGKRSRTIAEAGLLEAHAPLSYRQASPPFSPSLTLSRTFFSGIPEDPFSCPVAINCLCPHLLGDASGRLGCRQNLFPDPIQRRGLPVRNLHSHRRHRLQGEVVQAPSAVS